MEDELKALLQRVGLGLDQILTRKRFLQWQASDELRLNRAAAELEPAHRVFIEKLYEHLADFGQPSAMRSDRAGLTRLKQRQQEYYRCRSEARRDGQELDSTCRSRWLSSH